MVENEEKAGEKACNSKYSMSSQASTTYGATPNCSQRSPSKRSNSYESVRSNEGQPHKMMVQNVMKQFGHLGFRRVQMGASNNVITTRVPTR